MIYFLCAVIAVLLVIVAALASACRKAHRLADAWRTSAVDWACRASTAAHYKGAYLAVSPRFVGHAKTRRRDS